MPNAYNGDSNVLYDTFSTFTGADIQAVIGYVDPSTRNYVQKIIATLSSITMSIVRETNPIWTMGSADWRAMARGKRSVSGTLTFSVFDRDPLVRDIFTPSQMTPTPPSIYGIANGLGQGYGGNMDAGVAASRSFAAAQNIAGLVSSSPRRYADQLPLFDVTISMTNEQGASSMLAVRSIAIVSQGQGYSIHDLENDQVYSYVARFVEPLTPITQLSVQNAGSFTTGVQG